DTLNQDSLQTYSAQLAAWVGLLSDDADILLYGCDIAAASEGQLFISELASLTGADIAASTNATGAAARGGDWELEASTGSIEAGLIFGAQAVAGYEHLLSATEVTDANAGSNRSTTEDTPLAIAGLSVDGDDPG